MKLNNLKPAEGSVKAEKRVGRGQGSGRGGTSTRGHKGQQSRAGYSRARGSEGGQMPLQRRVPKFGFKNPFRVSYTAMNLSKLQEIADKYQLTEVTPEKLHELRIIKKTELIKVLANGELKAKLAIKAHAYSETAKAAVEAAGGSIEKIEK